MKKPFVLSVLILVLLAPAFAQSRGRQLSSDDQRRFDSYFSRWQDYQRTNNRGEMRSMEERMQDVYRHYGFHPTLLTGGSRAMAVERGGTGIAIGIGNGIGTASGTGIGQRIGSVIATATAIIGTRTSVFQVKIRAASTVIFSAGKTTAVPTTATK
jgi:hypothetical protein